MSEIILSEIRIHPVRPNDKGLVSFASFALNQSFYCGNIALYTSPNSPFFYRLVFPTKVVGNGQQIPCFYPFNSEVNNLLTKAVVDEYLRIVEKK